MVTFDPPTMATIAFFLSFLSLAFLGVPLAISLGISSIIVALIVGTATPYLLVQAFYYPFSLFTLISIYFFVFMGIVFKETGLASLLVEFLYPLVGRKRYGLPIVIVLGSAIFGLLTGSAVATAATFATLLGGEMVKKGYPKEFTAAVVAAAGPLGALIPPSIPAIVLATSTNTSVLTNFAVVGGIGVIYTILLVAYVILITTRRGYGVIERVPLTFREVLIRVAKMLPILIVPAGMLGGIYLGIFSVTEGGALGSLLSILLAMAYRKLNIKTLINILISSATTTAAVFFLIATSYMVSYAWSLSNVYIALNSFLGSTLYVGGSILTLLVVAALLLVLGLFLDLIIFNITLAPVIITLLKPFGVNPYLVNGLFATGNLIGTVTPPVGTVLAATCKAMDIQISSKVVRDVWILLAPFLILFIAMIFIPDIALWLPKLLGLPLS